MQPRPVQFADFIVSEESAVCRIIRRYYQDEPPGSDDAIALRMDLSATHVHTPLRLADLAEAGAVDFTHDVAGIRRHLDRSTGRLTGHFLPRFVKPTP